MKINSNSSTKNCAEIGKKLIYLFQQYPISEDPYYTDILKKLSVITEELINSINRGGVHNDRKEKDAIRDADVRAVFYEVMARCNRRPSENQKKALRIKKILDRFGIEITEYTYINESANINAMLIDLTAPELSEERASIPDLNELLANLEGSQADFNLSNMQLIEDSIDRKKTKSATVLAKEVRDLINNELSVYLQSMAMAKPSQYKEFAGLLHTIIADNNKSVADHLLAVKRKKENIQARIIQKE
ncbi:DUF6261 family protein [Labilibaculum sp. K2S]|uniref:DUF6261 family protein n=1 Tax=Labilibaculum sp. K2S TaxID=3056386 RepID=UPI0025A3CDE6|nr:DUF6261 family protein [Labilibaculum sp. K2S]MDM8161133.1 DUF6261 family protein [Labilibaculum sp. K2S]